MIARTIMPRNAISIVLALLFFAGSAAAETATIGPATTLRPATVVDGTFVRLGDLFDGTGAKAEIPVAQAPAPGQSLVFDYRALLRLARANRLSWRPASGLEQVQVARASQRLGTDQIRDAVTAAIQARGSASKSEIFEIVFDGLDPVIDLPTGVPATVVVNRLDYDSRTGRFAAALTAPAEGSAAVQQVVSGAALALVDIPVPVRYLEPGDPIAENDLEWQRQRANLVGSNTVVTLEQLLGKTPRRALRPGEAIRVADLKPMVTVRKGSLVTVMLRTAALTATVQGKALDNGVTGEAIRVANTKSNRVLTATVVDSGTVVVAAAGY
jgi:flagella basal body P-ring formation protein FlgA